MSTYTYDVTTNIGKVRLLIGDTDISPTTDAQFSDEEIQVFLTMGSSSLLLAASYALEAWASALSGDVKTERIGDYSYSKDSAGAKKALAEKYRAEDASNPAMAWSEWDLTTSGSGITAEED